MSELRQSFLELIRVLGNHSGCHQLPERSFFCKGKQFPVCARCTGVTVGQAGAVLLALLGKIVPVRAAVLLLGIMGLDWLAQETGWKVSTNRRRFVTGICGGLGIFSLYIRAGKSMIERIRRK